MRFLIVRLAGPLIAMAYVKGHRDGMLAGVRLAHAEVTKALDEALRP
jgi:hypothetical protein